MRGPDDAGMFVPVPVEGARVKSGLGATVSSKQRVCFCIFAESGTWAQCIKLCCSIEHVDELGERETSRLIKLTYFKPYIENKNLGASSREFLQFMIK